MCSKRRPPLPPQLARGALLQHRQTPVATRTTHGHTRTRCKRAIRYSFVLQSAVEICHADWLRDTLPGAVPAPAPAAPAAAVETKLLWDTKTDDNGQDTKTDDDGQDDDGQGSAASAGAGEGAGLHVDGQDGRAMDFEAFFESIFELTDLWCGPSPTPAATGLACSPPRQNDLRCVAATHTRPYTHHLAAHALCLTSPH